jgi:signal transduction histidine kinase
MADFLQQGPWGLELLKPEAFLGLSGMDNLTHSLVWSLLGNVAVYVGVSLARPPSAAETSQALLFVDVFNRRADARPVFWQGRAQLPALRALMLRFLGGNKTDRLLQSYARSRGAVTADALIADARLVQFVETQLAGAIGSASARVMVASVVEEEALDLDDVMRILDEASQLRAYSQALEEKSLSLEKATNELREANDKLKSLDRLKDDFMSSVTHELRTPLTSIRAFAELMRDDESMDPAQRQQFLVIIVAETERLTRLVNQVLDMAKIEAGAAEWNNAEVDMSDLLRRAASSMAETFRERGVRLDLVLPESVASIWADADRLMQVVLNLLSNAAKYAPRNEGVVCLRLEQRASELAVSVSDNGPGIPADQQGKVFEKFRQIEGDAHYRPGGTGLGLPISRQIVEHLGGRLWLESVPGAGARFVFALPLASVAVA